MGICEQTFHRWQKKHGGMGTCELRKMKMLEEENRKLKRLVADLSLDKAMPQDVLSNHWRMRSVRSRRGVPTTMRVGLTPLWAT